MAERPTITNNRPPRKVIVGTTNQGFWGKSPKLDERFSMLAGLVGKMAADAKKKYGRGLDLAVLPEEAVTAGRKGPPVKRSLAFGGKVQEFFAGLAREHNCYIVVPMDLLEDKEKKICYNACVLVDRKGKTVGVYRKMHLAVQHRTNSMEGGMTPGRRAKAFDCDFGKLGMQICFDMAFDPGWNQLAEQDADLVVWPTMSPQTCHPAMRAAKHGYYIVSSTWRNNCSVFEPTGKIVAQAKPPQRILVTEIDLSYTILPWCPPLKNGRGLKEKFGDKVGFRYYEDEDCGIFWSNDPKMPIGKMAESIGVVDWREERRRLQKLFRKAGVGALR